MQYFLRQFFHILAGIGYLAPEKHTDLFLIVGATECFHYFTGKVTAVPVVPVVSVVPVGFGFQGGCSRQLHGAEHSTVDVAFHFQYPLYEFGI